MIEAQAAQRALCEAERLNRALAAGLVAAAVGGGPALLAWCRALPAADRSAVLRLVGAAISDRQEARRRLAAEAKADRPMTAEPRRAEPPKKAARRASRHPCLHLGSVGR